MAAIAGPRLLIPVRERSASKGVRIVVLEAK